MLIVVLVLRTVRLVKKIESLSNKKRFYYIAATANGEMKRKEARRWMGGFLTYLFIAN